MLLATTTTNKLTMPEFVAIIGICLSLFGVMVITVNSQQMFWRVNLGRVKKTTTVFYRSLAWIGHEQQKLLVYASYQGNWERARGHGFKSRPARHQLLAFIF
jgi:hypothetical protein